MSFSFVLYDIVVKIRILIYWFILYFYLLIPNKSKVNPVLIMFTKDLIPDPLKVLQFSAKSAIECCFSIH